MISNAVTRSRPFNGHPSNALSPIDVTEFGIVIDARLVQFQNAPLPIDVTESGIVIDARLVQSLNTLLPIDVTASGIVIEVSLVQFQNASLPIDVTELGIVIDVTVLSLHSINTLSVIYKLLDLDSFKNSLKFFIIVMFFNLLNLILLLNLYLHAKDHHLYKA